MWPLAKMGLVGLNAGVAVFLVLVVFFWRLGPQCYSSLWPMVAGPAEVAWGLLIQP